MACCAKKFEGAATRAIYNATTTARRESETETATKKTTTCDFLARNSNETEWNRSNKCVYSVNVLYSRSYCLQV